MPKYIGSGAHERGKVKYRFMVMERFGEDVEKLFCAAGRKFQMKTVCYLALRIVSYLNIIIYCYFLCIHDCFCSDRGIGVSP